MKGPIFRTSVDVRLRRADGKTTAGIAREFEVPHETRLLKQSDVHVLQCSEDANANWCNPTSTNFTGSIQGSHGNWWGTIGLDMGDDRYYIELKNGWVFSRIDKLLKYQGSEAGDWVTNPKPKLPVGASEWWPTFEWQVTPSDEVRYKMWVEVVRPKGVY